MSVDGASPAAARGWSERWLALCARFGAERERWPLWLPVGLGLGIALYFALPVEPERWWAMAALALLAAGAAMPRLPARPAMSALLACALGFGAAQWRTRELSTPMLDRTIGPVEVRGRVIDAEARGAGWRVTIDRVRITGTRAASLNAERMPRKLRVTLRRSQAAPAIGVIMTVRATLLPPPEPAAPGGYDFQRRAYFDGIGGTGFALGQPRFAPADPADWDFWGGDWSLWFAGLRRAITERFMAALPEPTGVMAAALVIGERGAIPEPVLAAFRDSGLAHLIAISGMNVWLVAAILLVTVRAGFALVPALALRYPIKKWAAVVAFLGTGGYLLLCGATVPTQRSFLMTGVVLFAILIDRTAISMRLCAWAAGALLLLAPENLHNPSFQMSFGAVVALIAAYEAARAPVASWRAQGGWGRTTTAYIAGLVAISAIAILATSPFSAYHFNRIAVYGLAANMIAVPLTSAWVMPWGVLALALLPFGLEKFALVPMGWGIDLIVWTAQTVAAWPGAVLPVRAMPDFGLALMVLGGLWLCLWQRRWRLAGLAPVALGLLGPLAAPPPDALISGDGRTFATRMADGNLAVWSQRGSRFAVDTWIRRNGQHAPAPWPESGEGAPDGNPRCDHQGCIYRAGGRVLAFAREPAALIEDCALADVVVAAIPARRLCRNAPAVIDRFDLWRHGAHAIWLGSTVRVLSVRAARGERPWVIAPPGRRR